MSLESIKLDVYHAIGVSMAAGGRIQLNDERSCDSYSLCSPAP